MTEISGFNLGSLTGLKFENLDKDNDGAITKEEYQSWLEQVQTDEVNLSGSAKTDTKDTKIANEDAQAVFEQEVVMEEALDEIKAQISIDFCGDNSKYIADIAFDLKDYLEEFKTNYEGDVSGMAEAFKEALPAKYEELKTSYLGSDPAVVKSAVLDDIIEGLVAETDESNLQLLGKFLEAEADNYIAAYEGEDLETDLKAHLEEYMKSDSEKLEKAKSEYQAVSDALGTYVDSGELDDLKNAARNFLEQALGESVNISLARTPMHKVVITDEASIQEFLDRAYDAETLRSTMDYIFEYISNDSLLSKIESGALTEADVPKTDAAAEGESTSQADTSAYQVDASKIHFNKEEFRLSYIDNFLNKDSLKNQFKLQIMNNLAAKASSFADVEAVFNNVYASSITEYMNNVPDNSIYSHFGRSYITTDSIIEDFTKIFNEKMAEAINKNNESNTDFDLNNIGTSEAGGVLSQWNITKNIYKKLEPQLQAEAQRMCDANGVQFDVWEYNTILKEAYNRGGSVQDFLSNFQTEFSMWVYDQRY